MGISTDRFSIFAIWEELYQAILKDVEINKNVHTSYTSPITKSCMDWMLKLGDAIKNNDTKDIELYLYNIGVRSSETIQARDQRRLLEQVSDEWMRPYYEFFQAAQILTILLDISK
jgi:hypothetical protein